MKKYDIKINGNSYSVELASIEGNNAQVIVNGERMNVEIEGTQVKKVNVANRESIHSSDFSMNRVNAPQAVIGARSANENTSKLIISPLPGTIIRLEVREGDSVRRGQRVAIIEAMKMENDILSPRDGIVETVFVREGDSVLEGDNIAKIG